MKLEGVYTALVTPMTADGKVDEKALRRLVDFQVEGGVHGLVPVGTTGESPTLDGEECKRVIQIVVEQARGRVPVIAGAGSNSTSEAIEYARDAKEVGAVATLQVAPYYNKPTNAGFLAHFRAIADAVDLPLVVYNIAGRTGKNIDNPTMLELAKHRNITAVKEASGDIGQVMDLIAHKPAGFTVLSGDDNLVFPIMALGGRGVISVVEQPRAGPHGEIRHAALQGRLGRGEENALRAPPALQGHVHRDQSDPDQGGDGNEGNDGGVLQAPDVPPGAEKQGVSPGNAQGAEGPVSARASLTKISGESCSALLPRSIPSATSTDSASSAVTSDPSLPEPRLLRMVFLREEKRPRQSAESTRSVRLSGASLFGRSSTIEETTSGTG